jgi:CheY-like chemotaxis protein
MLVLTKRGGAMPTKPLILCVDDELNGLKGHKELLEENGCEVLAATSGVEALQLFDTNSVDLVLLDYHMPGMNGDAVAGLMKARKSDVPIAILSAEEGIEQRVLRAVDAYITKSESLANFLEIVELLLNLRVLFAPLDLDDEGLQGLLPDRVRLKATRSVSRNNFGIVTRWCRCEPAS